MSGHELERWVIFMNAPDKKQLKFLKSGFRHCLYAEKQGKTWIVIDPLSTRTECILQCDDKDGNPIARLKQAGFLCVEVKSYIKPIHHCSLEILSCVTQVKRLLGIQSWRVQTPYQLYKFIQKELKYDV